MLSFYPLIAKNRDLFSSEIRKSVVEDLSMGKRPGEILVLTHDNKSSFLLDELRRNVTVANETDSVPYDLFDSFSPFYLDRKTVKTRTVVNTNYRNTIGTNLSRTGFRTIYMIIPKMWEDYIASLSSDLTFDDFCKYLARVNGQSFLQFLHNISRPTSFEFELELHIVCSSRKTYTALKRYLRKAKAVE